MGHRNGGLVNVKTDCIIPDDLAIALVATCLVKTTAVESFLFHSPFDQPVPASHHQTDLKEQVLCLIFLSYCFRVEYFHLISFYCHIFQNLLQLLCLEKKEKKETCCNDRH